MPRCFSDQADADAIPVYLLPKDGVAVWQAEQKKPVAEWLESNSFKGADGKTIRVPGADGTIGSVLAGCGDAVDAGSVMAAMAGLAETLPEGTYALATDLDKRLATLAAVGWASGSYQFTPYKDPGRTRPQLTIPKAADALYVQAIADGAALTRDLVNTPANDMGPAELADAVEKLATEFGAQTSTIEGEDLLEGNFPAIYAVGKGSARAPRLIDMTWGNEANPLVTVVGKGVCFDTGGYNLKPTGAMALMKKDMGGAAHALGLAHIIMAMGLNIRLRVLIPAVENSVSGTAFRPGDIISTRKGLSVEIGNTDAEGRLVLADALALGCEGEPELMLDFATLTGAARSALGPDIPPFFTEDDTLAQALTIASEKWHDPVWRLPLWQSYAERIKSQIADINNDGGPFAGAITAALFLQRFVETGIKWVHFDIYAWNPHKKAGRPIGAAAQTLRAVYELISDIAK